MEMVICLSDEQVARPDNERISMKNICFVQGALQQLRRLCPATHLIAASIFAVALFCVSPAKAGSGSRNLPAPAPKTSPGPAGACLQTTGKPTFSENASCASGQIGFENRGTDRFGGRIYSTGVGDVRVKILDPTWPNNLTPPTSASVGIPDSISSLPELKNHCIWIYLKRPGSERLIGQTVRDDGDVVNLGELPPGEIILDIHVLDKVRHERFIFVTGDATNNFDNLVHAVVRTYSVQTQTAGRMQVWFEDCPGPFKGWGGSTRNFTGVVLELTGGVSDSSAVADLLKVINEQKDPVRQAAIDSLKKIDPPAAANAGF
jgi:hypothetical protein